MALIIPALKTNAIQLAVDYLKSGAVIAVPTDTVYGLICDSTNSFALNKLFKIKCRNENKPLAICLGEVSEVESWAGVKHLPEGLLSSLLPGPVTLILQCINKLDSCIICKNKVGIRVPNCTFIRNLAIGLGKPLALSSANLSNKPSAVDVSELSDILNKIPAIFDGGNLGSGYLGSTIVDLSDTNSYSILRKGVAHKETIQKLQKFGLTHNSKQ